MKSLKKLAACLFALMLGASLAVAPATAFADIEYNGNVNSLIASGGYVIDQSGLMAQSDVDRLNAMAKEVESKYHVKALYVTVDSLEGYVDASDFTDEFVSTYSVDAYNSEGCVVLLVCLSQQQFAMMAQGDVSSTLTSSVLDYLIDDVNPYLGRSDWAGAGETFFGDVSQTLSGQTANSTTDIAYNGTYVTDDYGLFSDEQRAALEAKATKLAQDYNMGVYLLVVDNMGSQNPTSAQRTNFATSFYRANDLGLGSGKDGIMLVIAAGSRDYVTIAYGQGSYSFSDEGIASMESDVTSYLGSNNWYAGSEAYYDDIAEQLEYYSVQGKPWTEPDPISLLLKLLAILGIPAAVAGSTVTGEKSAMKTAREKQEAYNYLDRGSFVVTNSRDEFVNTTLSVVPIPKHDDDHDSGGGFGGGGWGGGGGGGFSSSGGGKF